MLLLDGRAPLADEPDHFVARHMLHALVADPLRPPVGDAHADGGEAGSGSLGSRSPSEHAPFRLGEHVLSADGEDIGHMPFARPAAWGETGKTSSTSRG